MPVRRAFRHRIIGAPGWVIPGSSADLLFSQNLAYVSGTATNPGAFLSVTNASGGYAQYVNGLWQSFGANTPRITDNGLLIEQASTNELLYARDMTQTAWVKVNMTAALTATGIDNTANSASTLTATAGNATILQTLSLTSQAETYSVFLKRVSGSGTINISENGGTNWTPVTLTNQWQRFSVEATLANPVCGIQIVTNGDVIAADFNQDEELAFATSPILTTSATVTRAADMITLTGAALTAALNAEAARFVTNGVNSTGANRLAEYISSLGFMLYPSSTGSRIQDNAGHSATAVIGGSGAISGLVKTAYGFDASSLTVLSNDGTKMSVSNAWAGGSATGVYLGNSNGSSSLNGYMLRATFSPVKGAFDNLTTGSNPT